LALLNIFLCSWSPLKTRVELRQGPLLVIPQATTAWILTPRLSVVVEDTGRIIREDKRGAFSSSSQDILNRLNIPEENWLKITTEFGALFKGVVGALPALTEYCEHLEQKRRQGGALKS
jgi:hypothetical protein